MQKRPGSVLSGAVWMFVISLLLFWLPLLGPLVAGFLGGRKSGSFGNAILAALLPALVIGSLVFFFASLLTGFPLFGFLAGAGGFALMAAHVIPLLIGAALGTLV